jgi:hypothetical protein
MHVHFDAEHSKKVAAFQCLQSLSGLAGEAFLHLGQRRALIKN